MTVKDLYEEAKEQGREDYDIVVCDGDSPGRYTLATTTWYDEKDREVFVE